MEISGTLSGRLPVLRSSTHQVPAVHWKERELSEMFGFELADHPEPFRDLLRAHTAWDHHPLRWDVPAGMAVPSAAGPLPSFRAVRGEGVSEIPAGPIHAGLIEPGHSRFFTIGERILQLQIRMEWQHKGIEKLFEGMDPRAGVHLAERISGDTTFGHALAYCRALEDLSGTEVPPRGQHLRALALEVERLTNHVGGLGGLSTDIAFAFGAAGGVSGNRANLRGPGAFTRRVESTRTPISMEVPP